MTKLDQFNAILKEIPKKADELKEKIRISDLTEQEKDYATKLVQSLKENHALQVLSQGKKEQCCHFNALELIVKECEEIIAGCLNETEKRDRIIDYVSHLTDKLNLMSDFNFEVVACNNIYEENFEVAIFWKV